MKYKEIQGIFIQGLPLIEIYSKVRTDNEISKNETNTI